MVKVDFTSNMKYVISSSLDCSLRVWEIETGECKRIIRTLSYFNTFYVSMNGDFVIAGTDNGNLSLIDITREHNHMYCRMQVGKHESNRNSRIRSITVSPDEKHVAIVKRDSVSILPFAEICRIGAKVTEAEKANDNDQLKALFATPFSSLVTHAFENDQIDFMGGQYTFNNRVMTFCRDKLV